MERDCEIGAELEVTARQAYVWVRIGLNVARLTPAEARQAARWLSQCADTVEAFTEESPDGA